MGFESGDCIFFATLGDVLTFLPKRHMVLQHRLW